MQLWRKDDKICGYKTCITAIFFPTTHLPKICCMKYVKSNVHLRFPKLLNYYTFLSGTTRHQKRKERANKKSKWKDCGKMVKIQDCLSFNLIKKTMLEGGAGGMPSKFHYL
jgi:hypothetical protein